jgi:hypothetical protein
MHGQPQIEAPPEPLPPAKSASPRNAWHRFAHLSPRAALGILLAAASLILLGVWASPTALPTERAAAQKLHEGDLSLYQAVVANMRQGAPYEAAAVAGHRARGYPLHPFFVVRPPFLADFLTLLPEGPAAAMVLAVLAALGVLGWCFRLLEFKLSLIEQAFMFMALASGSIPALIGGGFVMFHEVWAGQLMLLSLLCRTERRFAASAILGLMAALVRELAMPYLLVMALQAFWERRWREGAAFALALALGAIALAGHAYSLHGLIAADDIASSGWLALGGWRFVLSAAQWNLFAVGGGPWVSILLVPLSLLGAAAMGGPAGIRLLLLLGGYTLGFTIAGRPDNYYWGLLTAPLAGLGLVFAPRAIWDLQTCAAGRAAIAAETQLMGNEHHKA